MELRKTVLEKQHITEEDYQVVADFVTSNYGIKLPPEKKVMVEGRLQKRLRATQLPTFKDYVRFVMSEEGKHENLAMIDAVSTNKTDFFRESSHFDYLREVFLPEWAEKQGNKPIQIWSAAASSGEECYTIAMVIEEFNLATNNRLQYSIFGTDISREILKKAVSAVYTTDRIEPVPIDLRKRYFLRSKDRQKDTVRLTPYIRSKCTFGRLNLMDADYKISNMFDVIFCRNVLIYFDQLNQEKVINKLCAKLKPDGFFFLGHSESILGKNVPLKQLKPTIYKRNSL